MKRPGGLGSWRTSGYNPNDSIAENDQNPETSPGDLKRLAVTQTPGKNHQLTLMGKTLIMMMVMIIMQTREISHTEIWTWLRKGNLKRETESFQIAA